MNVDDKLAKEKLAQLIEVLVLPVEKGDNRDPEDELFYEFCSKAARLIRNTDLTDCQPQKAKAMNEHSSGTRAEVPTSATDSGTPDETAWLIEMPAARWGSSYCWCGVRGVQYRHSPIKSIFGPIDKAIRFSRKEDAERVIEQIGTDAAVKIELEACEHMWSTTEGNARESARDAGSGINKEVVAPDQGSVRNATDRLTDEEIIKAWQDASDKQFDDLLAIYLHRLRAVADAQLKKAIRALPDQKD